MADGLRVTLVVPVHDEEDSLGHLIASIESQARAPDEVVLVDSGSTDSTGAILAAACAEHPSWSSIEVGPATPGRARNAGIAASAGEWIALTDAGITLDRHWLSRLVRFVVADPTLDVVWGHYEPVTDRWFTACASLAYVARPTATARGPVRGPSVASCLLRKSMWEKVGGFPDQRAAEDLLFIRRLDDVGARQGWAPESVVHWQLQPGFASTYRRFRTYSKANADAGLQHGWHLGVARMYLAALPFLLLGLRRRRWLLVPMAGLAARVEKGMWQRRQGRPIWWVLNPARIVTVGLILVVIDAGTFSGWLESAAG